MKQNKFLKVVIYIMIASMLLSTIIFSLSWMFT